MADETERLARVLYETMGGKPGRWEGESKIHKAHWCARAKAAQALGVTLGPAPAPAASPALRAAADELSEVTMEDVRQPEQRAAFAARVVRAWLEGLPHKQLVRAYQEADASYVSAIESIDGVGEWQVAVSNGLRAALRRDLGEG
jgi:hypothetical protein